MPKLKIGPLTFDVRKAPANLGEIAEWDDPEDDDAYFGGISHTNQIIFLNEDNTPDRGKVALLHEVLHAVSEQYAAELSEGQVSCIATGLVDVLNRNKWFREELCTP